MMIRMKTVKIIVNVTSSALAMVPNTTIEMCIRIRNRKEMTMTTMMVRVMMITVRMMEG